jgi:6-phosphofructo-2-kinase
MRLKLSGPDYKDKDPVKSLEDFKARVKQYESAYVPLGDYEEEHGMQYIKVSLQHYKSWDSTCLSNPTDD